MVCPNCGAEQGFFAERKFIQLYDSDGKKKGSVLGWVHDSTVKCVCCSYQMTLEQIRSESEQN